METGLLGALRKSRVDRAQHRRPKHPGFFSVYKQRGARSRVGSGVPRGLLHATTRRTKRYYVEGGLCFPPGFPSLVLCWPRLVLRQQRSFFTATRSPIRAPKPLVTGPVPEFVSIGLISLLGGLKIKRRLKAGQRLHGQFQHIAPLKSINRL